MSCKTDESDNRTTYPLQSLLKPRGQRYTGQLFDISSRHSIQIVGDSSPAALIAPDLSHVVIDYFYHEGTYWRARVPLDGVQHVFGQAFNFSKARTRSGENGPELIVDHQGVPKPSMRWLNHLQSRFTFAADYSVELYPLEGELTGEPHHRVGDLIYSIEAVGPLGVRFNLRDALAGNLIGAHRLLSTREMVFERIVVENMHVLESPPLPLSDVQRRAALTASILRSHRASMSETYYLYRVCGTNNCTSGPLREIDRIASYNLVQRLGTLLYRFPISPRLYLRLRGLDSDPKVRKLVRDEFAQYISHPETVKRKRSYVRSRTQALRAARDARR
jgi:hypothetical protein